MADLALTIGKVGSARFALKQAEDKAKELGLKPKAEGPDSYPRAGQGTWGTSDGQLSSH